MPRNVKDSDDEMEPKTGRRTRTTLNSSVLDSPLRRSTRSKQPTSQETHSPESNSDSSVASSTRNTRRRTVAADTAVLDSPRQLRTRRNSTAVDYEEILDEALGESTAKRTTRRSLAAQSAVSTPTKLRPRRNSRAGSETKSTPPVTRITRRTRASSMGPEITEEPKSQEIGMKSKRHASVLPSEPDVAEESVDSSRTLEKTVFEIDEKTPHNTPKLLSRKSKDRPTETVEPMDVDQVFVVESGNDPIDESIQVSSESRKDVSHLPKIEEPIEMSSSTECTESIVKMPNRRTSGQHEKDPSYKIENLLNEISNELENNGGNKENEAVNDPLFLEKNVPVSDIDYLCSRRYPAVIDVDDEPFVASNSTIVSKQIVIPTKDMQMKKSLMEDCVVVIESIDIGKYEKTMHSKGDRPKTESKKIVNKNHEIIMLDSDESNDSDNSKIMNIASVASEGASNATMEMLQKIVSETESPDCAEKINNSEELRGASLAVPSISDAANEILEVSSTSNGNVKEFEEKIVETHEIAETTEKITIGESLERSLQTNPSRPDTTGKTSEESPTPEENPRQFDDDGPETQEICEKANAKNTEKIENNDKLDESLLTNPSSAPAINEIPEEAFASAENPIKSDQNETEPEKVPNIEITVPSPLTDSQNSNESESIDVEMHEKPTTNEKSEIHTQLTESSTSRENSPNPGVNENPIVSETVEEKNPLIVTEPSIERGEIEDPLTEEVQDHSNEPPMNRSASRNLTNGEKSNKIGNLFDSDNESETVIRPVFKDIPADEWQLNKDEDRKDDSSIHSMSTERNESPFEIDQDKFEIDKEITVSTDKNRILSSVYASKLRRSSDLEDSGSDVTVVANIGGKRFSSGQQPDSVHQESSAITPTKTRKSLSTSSPGKKFDKWIKSAESAEDAESEEDGNDFQLKLAKSDKSEDEQKPINSKHTSEIDEEASRHEEEKDIESEVNTSVKSKKDEKSINSQNNSVIGTENLETAMEVDDEQELDLNESVKSKKDRKSLSSKINLIVGTKSLEPAVEDDDEPEMDFNESLKSKKGEKSLRNKNNSIVGTESLGPAVENDDEPEMDLNESVKSKKGRKSLRSLVEEIVGNNSIVGTVSLEPAAEDDDEPEMDLNESVKSKKGRKSLRSKNNSIVGTVSLEPAAEDDDEPEMDLNESVKFKKGEKSLRSQNNSIVGTESLKPAVEDDDEPEMDLKESVKFKKGEKSLRSQNNSIVGTESLKPAVEDDDEPEMDLKESVKSKKGEKSLRSKNNSIVGTENLEPAVEEDDEPEMDLMDESVESIKGRKSLSNKNNSLFGKENLEPAAEEDGEPEMDLNESVKSKKDRKSLSSKSNNSIIVTKKLETAVDKADEQEMELNESVQSKKDRKSLSNKNTPKMQLKNLGSKEGVFSGSEMKFNESPRSKKSQESSSVANYSTVAQVDSDSELQSSDECSDVSETDGNVFGKYPKFLCSRNDDSQSSESIDSDIVTDLNLYAKDIVTYSDDDVPADDCMHTESESEDSDDGQDLKDFLVDDDEEVSCDESSDSDDNSASKNSKKRKSKSRIIRPSDGSQSDDEAMPSDLEEKMDKFVDVTNQPSSEVNEEEQELYSNNLKSSEISSASEDEENIFEKSNKNENLNNSKNAKPKVLIAAQLATKNVPRTSIQSSTPIVEASLASEKKLNSSRSRDSGKFFNSPSNKLETSVKFPNPVENRATPAKSINTSIKEAKTPKTPLTTKAQLNASLSKDSNKSSEKIHHSKVAKGTKKIVSMNHTLVEPSTTSPETIFLMKDKLNDSLPALKLAQKNRSRRSTLDNFQEQAMNQVLEEDESIPESAGDETIIQKSTEENSLGESSKTKNKKKKRKNAGKKIAGNEETLEDLADKSTGLGDLEETQEIAGPSKKLKKSNKKAKKENSVNDETPETDDPPKKKKKKQKMENLQKAEAEDQPDEETLEDLADKSTTLDDLEETQEIAGPSKKLKKSKKKAKKENFVNDETPEIDDPPKKKKKKQRMENLQKAEAEDQPECKEKVLKKLSSKTERREKSLAQSMEESVEAEQSVKKSLKRSKKSKRVDGFEVEDSMEIDEAPKKIKKKSHTQPEVVPEPEKDGKSKKKSHIQPEVVPEPEKDGKKRKKGKKNSSLEESANTSHDSTEKRKKKQKNSSFTSENEQTRSRVKRLPDEIIESLGDVAERPKKRRKIVSEEKSVATTSKNSKNRATSSGLNRDDYVPLSFAGSTTQFNVVDLRKEVAKKSKPSLAVRSFRERMLARNPRVPISAYLMYKEKQKASGTHHF